MDITTSIDGAKATLSMTGKLTTSTSPDLAAAIDQIAGIVSDIDLDLSGLDYISSAGLRVILGAQKLAAKSGGELRLLRPNESLMEVFDMTGLSDIMNIER